VRLSAGRGRTGHRGRLRLRPRTRHL